MYSGLSGGFEELVVLSGDFIIILVVNNPIEDAAEDMWFHFICQSQQHQVPGLGLEIYILILCT